MDALTHGFFRSGKIASAGTALQFWPRVIKNWLKLALEARLEVWKARKFRFCLQIVA